MNTDMNTTPELDELFNNWQEAQYSLAYAHKSRANEHTIHQLERIAAITETAYHNEFTKEQNRIYNMIQRSKAARTQ